VQPAIANNLDRIRERIAAACQRSNRPSESVTLIAVTKSVGLDEVRCLHAQGLRHFGESRIQDAESKVAARLDGAIWHMIGSVQRRKAKDVCRLFDRVDSVDRLELAVELAKRLPPGHEPLPLLLEVNVSGEATKHGFAPQSLGEALHEIEALPNLRIEGLMTMAPLYADAQRTRPVFATLRALAVRYKLSRISMGMSNDFEIAIEEGSTEVRVGSALFEGLKLES